MINASRRPPLSDRAPPAKRWKRPAPMQTAPSRPPCSAHRVCRRLFRQVRDMDKPALDLVLAAQTVQQAIHDMVAHIGAGGLRNGGRNAGLAHRTDHRFNRQSAEIGRRTAGDDRLIHRLLPLIVGDTRVVDVDRHPFNRDVGTAAGPPIASTITGCTSSIAALSASNAAPNTHGSWRATMRVPTSSISLSCFTTSRGVEALAAKRLKAGNQYFCILTPTGTSGNTAGTR